MPQPLAPLHVIIALAVLAASIAGIAVHAQAPAPTGGPAPFSEVERQAIGDIVHDYLMNNPEVIPAAIQVLQQRQRAQRLAMLADELAPGPASIEAGNPQGDVTMVEFFDFRCPYCRRAYRDVKRLLAEDPKLRVIFKQFPILDDEGDTLSYDLARTGAAAARQGRYLAFHEAVFTAPTRIASAADIDAVARSAGLDIARLHTDMQDPAIANAIERNRALGHALDLSGTPAYVIGSQIIDGAVGYERMKAAITAERSQGETAQNGG